MPLPSLEFGLEIASQIRTSQIPRAMPRPSKKAEQIAFGLAGSELEPASPTEEAVWDAVAEPNSQ